MSARAKTKPHHRVGKLAQAVATAHAPAEHCRKGPDLYLKEVRTGREALFVDVRINGKMCSLLVDTGATVSILRPDIVDAYKLPHETSRFRTLQTAGNQIVDIMGECEVTGGIGRKEFRHKFLIVRIRDKGILGLDVLQKLEAELSIPKAMLRLEGSSVPLKTRRQCLERAVQAAINGHETQWIDKALKSTSLVEGSKDYEDARAVFLKYRHIFAEGKQGLGRTNVVEHTIDMVMHAQSSKHLDGFPSGSWTKWTEC